jgi:hypothetical protein
MSRLRRALVLVLLLGVALGAYAHDAKALTEPERARAEAVAEAAFPFHCQPVQYAYVDSFPDWESGGPTLTIALADPAACTITMHRSAPFWLFRDYCNVLVHEYGHLAGLGHSDTGIMQPLGGTWPECGSEPFQASVLLLTAEAAEPVRAERKKKRPKRKSRRKRSRR